MLYIIFILLFPSRLTAEFCYPGIAFCANYYNQTKLPNKYDEDNFSKVVGILMSYKDIASSECHQHVALFICSMLFPACTPGYEITLPCHDFCEDVKKSCSPFIRKARISWPFYFECLGLPRRRKGRFCVNGKFKSSDLKKLKPLERKQIAPIKPKIPDKVIDPEDFPDSDSNEITEEYSEPKIAIGIELVTTPPKNRRDEADYKQCPGPVLFSHQQLNVTRAWVLGWSIVAITLSFVVTFLALIQGKAKAPENIIVIISCCYIVKTLAFLMGSIFPQRSLDCSTSSPIYLKPSSPSPTCLLIFTSVYFTSLAGTIWWVVLTFLWFLMLGLKWSDASVSKMFKYLHVVTWIPAAGLTISVLVLGAVEGDELSGLCLPGAINPQNLATFDITPNTILLAIGAVVLLCGFYIMLKLKKLQNFKQLDIPFKRLISLGIFSSAFFFVSLIKVLCQVYELSNRLDWYRTCDPNNEIKLNQSLYDTEDITTDTPCGPDYKIFILKYTCYLVLPITVAFYLKTIINLSDITKKFVPLAKNYTRAPSETTV